MQMKARNIRVLPPEQGDTFRSLLTSMPGWQNSGFDDPDCIDEGIAATFENTDVFDAFWPPNSRLGVDAVVLVLRLPERFSAALLELCAQPRFEHIWPVWDPHPCVQQWFSVLEGACQLVVLEDTIQDICQEMIYSEEPRPVLLCLWAGERIVTGCLDEACERIADQETSNEFPLLEALSGDEAITSDSLCDPWVDRVIHGKDAVRLRSPVDLNQPSPAKKWSSLVYDPGAGDYFF